MRDWLRNTRKNEQLTQFQLAKLVGVDITTIGKYELGKLRPSPKTAKKIDEKLNFHKYGFTWTKFFEENESDVRA